MTHPASFAAFLRSDAFKRRTTMGVISMGTSYAWPETFWPRLIRDADEIDTKVRLSRWIKERWPNTAFSVADLWAGYLEWADAQPRLTHQQIRDAAGAELRRVFMPAE